MRATLAALAALTAALAACASPARDHAAGEPCVYSSECTTGLCLGERHGYPDGVCTATCTSTDCEAGTTCVTVGDRDLCMPSCASGETCRDGWVCGDDAGACLPDCRDGWDCGDVYTCQTDGACGLEATLAAPVGSPCARAIDCAGVCFTATDTTGAATGWTDGLCAAPCGSTSCGEDTDCIVLDGTAWCLPSCTAGTCRSGYVCSSDLALCLPDCRLGWSCGDAFVCDADSGECVIDTTTTTSTLAEVGAACTTHADCQSGVCLQPPSATSPWPYAVCTQPCALGCPADTACAPLGTTTLCLPSCAAGCPTGFVCGPQGTVCLPSCAAAWPCPTGSFCNGQGFCAGTGRGSR